MAKVTATERTRQQGARLRQLRERLGVSKGALIDALAFGSTQTYDLYERGVSVLRLDLVPEWAAAFGISEWEFVEAVLCPSKPYDFRAELELAYPERPDLIEQAYALDKDAPEIDQRATVEALREKRALTLSQQNGSHRTAARCAEDRADYRRRSTGT